jgi:ketosteroid isomerase-like protein
MSQENVEIVQRAGALLNQGDWDELASVWHPDIVFCDLRNAVDAQQVLTGSDSVRGVLAQWREVFDDFGAEVHEYLDGGAYVICETRWYATGQQSQMPIDVRQVDVYELRDGRIVGITLGYTTKAEALEAVGLRE